MIRLESSADGVLLPVKAKASARTNSLQGVHDGALKVSVTQAPERGKANQAIIDLLAEELGLRRSQIAICAGETSSQKRFRIQGITPEELAQRIEGALNA